MIGFSQAASVSIGPPTPHEVEYNALSGLQWVPPSWL